MFTAGYALVKSFVPKGAPLKPADASPCSLSNASHCQIKIFQRSSFLLISVV